MYNSVHVPKCLSNFFINYSWRWVPISRVVPVFPSSYFPSRHKHSSRTTVSTSNLRSLRSLHYHHTTHTPPPGAASCTPLARTRPRTACAPLSLSSSGTASSASSAPSLCTTTGSPRSAWALGTNTRRTPSRSPPRPSARSAGGPWWWCSCAASPASWGCCGRPSAGRCGPPRAPARPAREVLSRVAASFRRHARRADRRWLSANSRSAQSDYCTLTERVCRRALPTQVSFSGFRRCRSWGRRDAFLFS